MPTEFEKLVEIVDAMSDGRRARLESLLEDKLNRPWKPQPGPQTDAYYSQADLLLYGGQAGGGKSDLLIGLAINEHEVSVIFRQTHTDARSLEDRLEKVVEFGKLNHSDHVWKYGDQRIEFGYLEKPGAEKKHQGRAKDFLGLDEGAQMQAHKIIFLMGWVRSTNPEQRCRTIIASNPPMAGDGDFLVEWFAPWLDPTYPDPAEPGELRWAVFVGDEHEIRSIWVDGPDPVEIEGQRREPESRTFIPSTLDDNRYLRDTDYSKKLDSLPEPMRSALKSGNFMASRKDHQWQVIPSDWIRLAQERWREDGGRHIPMWCLAADIAQGGNDKTTLAPLHDQWFGNLGVHKGIETKNGPDVAALILAMRRNGADVAIDCTGGWGGSTRDHLRTHNQIYSREILFSAKSDRQAIDTQLGFRNYRAEMYWRFREALNPGGEYRVAL
ncbi:MAG: hypothetical protein JKY49_04260, partial [Cohaesibacteraceae bacterium]|nr:hypothetical protein [Cohaesibacteraceae bacterium]